MRILLVVCVCVTLMAYQTGALSTEVDDENIIQPIPFPEGEWKLVKDTKRADFLELMWTGKVDDIEGIIQTSVFRGRSLISIDKLRQIDEESGREACAKLTSETLKQETQNSYRVLQWKITCMNSDGSRMMTAIHKAIAGNDATYKITKTWWPEASKESWSTWVEYFQKVHVCDSRLEDRKCPSGYRRVR